MATKGYIPEKSGSKVPPEFAEKFNEIQQRNYVGQGKWFLNGFWESLSNPEQDAEQIWGYAQKFAELDTKRKKEGVDLDEFESHKFLETLGETMTVIQMRQALREIDLDNNNRMSLIEYLTFKYKKKVGDVVNAPQGGVDPAKLKEAQELIDKANQALEEMQIRLQQQKEAEDEAKRTEQDAKKKLGIAQEAENEQKKKLEEQKKAEEEVRNAEEELRKILDEIKKQEQDYKDKCDDLERKTKEGTIVQKNRAVQELAALKQEDPLPLRKAKISQEAAVRKAEKVTKAAQEITRQVEELTRQMEQKRQVAQEAAEEAEKKRQEAEEAARQTELAVEDARQKVQEAEDNFEKVRQECKTAFGDIFWMERDIKEAKKYLPKSKQ